MVGQEARLSAPKKIWICGLHPCRSRKLKPIAKKEIFVSYPSGVKGYKGWLLEEKKCVISRNVLFAEDKVYKDLSVCEVKADVTEKLRNQTVLEETTGFVRTGIWTFRWSC